MFKTTKTLAEPLTTRQIDNPELRFFIYKSANIQQDLKLLTAVDELDSGEKGNQQKLLI